jgi:hypothetical protein
VRATFQWKFSSQQQPPCFADEAKASPRLDLRRVKKTRLKRAEKAQVARTALLEKENF